MKFKLQNSKMIAISLQNKFIPGRVNIFKKLGNQRDKNNWKSTQNNRECIP